MIEAAVWGVIAAISLVAAAVEAYISATYPPTAETALISAATLGACAAAAAFLSIEANKRRKEHRADR